MAEPTARQHPTVLESSSGSPGATAISVTAQGVASASAPAYTDRSESARPASNPFDTLRHTAIAGFVLVLGYTLLVQHWQGISLVSVLFFLIVALASELLPVTLPDGNAEITLTPILVWAVVALVGPGYGVIMAFCSSFLGSLLYRKLVVKSAGSRQGFWQFLTYNSCVIGTNTGVGALIYHALGGTQLVTVSIEALPLSRIVAPLFAATFVALGMDVLSYAVGSAVAESAEDGDASFETIWMRAKVIWFKNVLAFLPSYVMFTPFAFVLAYLFVWRDLGFWGVLPILIPFFSVRQTLNLIMAHIRTYRQTITTLATLMQKYHPYTRGHLKRVADLSARLARELRLPASSQQWIWEAGLLHDIGKVGVSEQILDKTERLTDEEWDVIKAHPVKSAEILEQLEFLDALVPWVRHHHERVDGKGYPDGLKEGEFPIEAAIIAVADAFDAMTGSRSTGDGKQRPQCDACGWKPEHGAPMPDACPECGATLIRVYRKPMSTDDGIRQIRYGVGTQFSPRVVRGFIRMMAHEDAAGDA